MYLAEEVTHEAMKADIEVEVPACNFEVGDNVVYPHHGAGVVLEKEAKDLLGENRDYLTIQILHNGMTAMVPARTPTRPAFAASSTGSRSRR